MYQKGIIPDRREAAHRDKTASQVQLRNMRRPLLAVRHRHQIQVILELRIFR